MIGVNGFGVIGKRVAAAVALPKDMSLAGVSDVVTDWRAHMVTRNGFSLFGATAEHGAGRGPAPRRRAALLYALAGLAWQAVLLLLLVRRLSHVVRR